MRREGGKCKSQENREYHGALRQSAIGIPISLTNLVRTGPKKRRRLTENEESLFASLPSSLGTPRSTPSFPSHPGGRPSSPHVPSVGSHHTFHEGQRRCAPPVGCSLWVCGGWEGGTGGRRRGSHGRVRKRSWPRAQRARALTRRTREWMWDWIRMSHN